MVSPDTAQFQSEHVGTSRAYKRAQSGCRRRILGGDDRTGGGTVRPTAEDRYVARIHACHVDIGSIAYSSDLLLQHAGLRERTPQAPSSDSTTSLAGLPAEVSFNPLFTMPAAAGPSTQAAGGSQAKESEPKITEEQPTAILQSPPTSSDAVRATPKSAEPTPTANTTTLQDVVEQFLETQQNLANSSKDQIDKLKGLQSADAVSSSYRCSASG